ncbi:hypothetical protein GCM10023263_62350 [Phytohabitans rumicis]
MVALLVTLFGVPQPAALPPVAPSTSAIKAAVATGVPTAVAAPELSTFGLAAATATLPPPPAGWSTAVRSTVDTIAVTYLLAYRGRAPPSYGVPV